MDIERRERLPVSISSSVVVEDEQGRLLLLQQAAERKGHKWGLPAGGMDAHEDPVMVAKREVKEEIGVDVDLVDLIGVYTTDRGDSSSGIGFAFRGRLQNSQLQPKEGEISAARYFTHEEIKDLASRDLIYKPEYNLPVIEDWFTGRAFPLESIKSISRGT